MLVEYYFYKVTIIHVWYIGLLNILRFKFFIYLQNILCCLVCLSCHDLFKIRNYMVLLLNYHINVIIITQYFSCYNCTWLLKCYYIVNFLVILFVIKLYRNTRFYSNTIFSIKFKKKLPTDLCIKIKVIINFLSQLNFGICLVNYMWLFSVLRWLI